MKKENKTKKILYRILKIIWGIIGGFILLGFMFFFIKTLTIQNLGGVFAAAVLMGTWIYLLFLYVIITLLFLFIKWIIKKLKCKTKK